ncbi:hypothetical protein PO909_030156, partial [Leuciscus waleckii]
DWIIFYNQIWRDLNRVGGNNWYFYKWGGPTPDVRDRVPKPGDNVSISTYWNKTLHDQHHLKLMNKHCEESETDFLFQSSDESDSNEWIVTGQFQRRTPSTAGYYIHICVTQHLINNLKNASGTEL